MLGTIKLPLSGNLKSLQNVLPEKNYDSDKERESSQHRYKNSSVQKRKPPNQPAISKRIPDGESLDEIQELSE
jgi:hypothetical protein